MQERKIISKVQTNLKLSAARAAALDIASAVEGKEKAQIVEEALQLREELMGADYSAMVEAALAMRSSDDPARRLQAIESLREDMQGATPGGSVTVEAAIARIRAQRPRPA